MLRVMCVLVTLVLLVPPVVSPTATAQVTSTKTETVDVTISIEASKAVTWDTTMNIADPQDGELNSDTWDEFLTDHTGVWVGGDYPESRVAAPGGVNGNLTVAGAAAFTPEEVMGGVTEGWVRSPIATDGTAGMDMSIWHVENPTLAQLEPGTTITQGTTDTIWTCIQSGATGCGGTSNDFVDDVGMQPELLNGEVVTDWYGMSPTGNAQDGNLFGWDITDQSGNGAVAMAPKVTMNNATWGDNLTGLWQLGEGAGSTTYDLSGNGNHGTITGASWTTDGRVGAALDFDGVSNDKVVMGAVTANSGSISFFTWIKTSGINSNYLIAENEDWVVTSDGGFRVLITGGQFRTYLHGYDSIQQCYDGPELRDGSWHFVGFTVDEAAQDYYAWIDGVGYDCGYGHEYVDSPDPLVIGVIGSSMDFDGVIDEVFFLNSALTSGQIADLYAGSYRTDEEVTYTSTYGSLAGVETSDGFSTVIHLNATYTLPGSDDFPGGQYMPDGDHDFGTDLVGYWPLDEDTGTTAPDHSGNGNHGTITGATWTTGKVGNALDFFDASGDDITIPADTSLDIADYTISFWFILSSSSACGSWDTLMTKVAQSNWQLFICGGHPYGISLYSLADGVTRLVSPFADYDTWHHLVITEDSGTVKAYLDGSLTTTDTVTPTFANSGNLYIGMKPSGDYYYGTIDEAAIWNRVLDAAEVAALYTQQQTQHLSASIPRFEVWSSNTTDFDDASLVATFEEGTDFDLDPVTGLHYIGLTVGVPYAPFWFWTANFTSIGNHTAVIHAAALRMEGFTQPFTLVPSPLSQPSLVWQKQYGPTSWMVGGDEDHENTDDRSYLKFRAPIWPARDADGDGITDDGYVFIFGCGSGCGTGASGSYEIWFSESSRGLDHVQSWVSLFDPDLLWFNDTMPASLGMDWLFERGMSHGVTGMEVETDDTLGFGPWLVFWHDLEETLDVAADEYLTFLMPFSANEPAAPLIYASGYDEDMAYIGITQCDNPGGVRVDYILCSGGTGAAPMRWSDTTQFQDARYIKFQVDFNGQGTEEQDVRVWLHDKNAEFDMETPELFNRAWHMDENNDLYNEVAFSPYYAAYIDDEEWCMETIADPCHDHSESAIEPTILPPRTGDVSLRWQLITQVARLEHMAAETADTIYDAGEWAMGIAECTIPNTRIDFMEDCAHRYVDAGAHIYEWVGDNWQWALLPTVALAAGASLLMDQQFTARFLETIAESGTWETVHTAGVYVLGVVEMVVPLIQSLLGQVADLALQMMTFVLFLIASSIIIGTTALINHALHGRWEIVNERTAASLAGAAGWMAVIPYVGPGFAAAGRSAISAGKRERVRR